MKIDFVQYERPHGEPRPVEIDLYVSGLEPLVTELRAAKWSFEIELLSTNVVFADICDEEGELANTTVPNGPGVGDAIVTLIRRAHAEWLQRGKPVAKGDRQRDAHRKMHSPVK